MPPAQSLSRMPKGLTPEEKTSYQKERNRRKQAALRARRKEESAAAPTSSSQTPFEGSTTSSSHSDTDAHPSPSIFRRSGSWNAMDEVTRVGIVEALARTDAEVARLTSTVGRLVQKLVELRVDDRTIGMLLGEGSTWTSSSKECPPSCSSLSSVAEVPTEIPRSHSSCFAGMEQGTPHLPASTSSSSSQPDLNLAFPPVPPPQPPSFPTPNHALWSSDPSPTTSVVDNALPFSTSSFTTSYIPSLDSQPYPSLDPFGLLPTSGFAPGLDAEMLRSALHLARQPDPSPLFNSIPLAQSETFAFWNSSPPTHPPQPLLQQQQSLEPVHLPPNLPSTQDSYLDTLFELHRAYLTSRRRSSSDLGYHSTVSAAAIKELQLAILRLLAATSDQRDAYLSIDNPLSPEDQAFLSTASLDERLMLLPTRPIIKLIFGKTTTHFDCALMIAEIIESARIFGDVCDITGWTMPASFWRDYKFDVPPELAGICTEVDPSTIPVGLRGSTIREIVMKTEQPGWRTAGPFPLATTSLQPVWEQSIWEQEWKEGRSSIFC